MCGFALEEMVEEEVGGKVVITVLTRNRISKDSEIRR